MVTLGDIAREAGVSIGTVERALKNKGRIAEKTKQRILETAERMGYKPNLVAQGLAVRKKNIRIAFFYVNDSFAPLQKRIAEDARNYARGLENYGIHVDFIAFEGQMPDAPVREKALWQHFEGKNVDAFAAIGPVAAEIEKILDKHDYGKIPYVSYNVRDENENSSELCFIGCDFSQAGRLSAGVVGLMLRGSGKACVLSIDYPEISSTYLRIQAFRRALEENYPGIEVSDILYTSPLEDFETYLAKVDAYLNAHPEIDVLYNVYAGSDEHISRIAEIGKRHHIPIVTGDLATPAQKDLLARRSCAAEIAQDVAEQGNKTMETLFNYLAYGTEPETKWIRTGVNVNLPESV